MYNLLTARCQRAHEPPTNSAKKKKTQKAMAAIGATPRPKGAGSHSCDTGSVFENDLEHVQRHKAEGKANACLRCIYLSDTGALQQHAKLCSPNGHGSTWLEPAPSYKGGSWALGCRACAWYRSQPQTHIYTCSVRRKHVMNPCKDPKRNSDPRFSKFANFSYRYTDQVTKRLAAHGTSQAHKQACEAMSQKDAALPTMGTVTSSPRAIDRVARQTFKGRVPQPLDWLDCFVESTNFVSWRKQARLCIGKSGATPSGVTAGQSKRKHAGEPTSESGQPLAPPSCAASGQLVSAIGMDNIRKRRRRQTNIMAECVRTRHKEAIRKAAFVSLALDEAQGRKLVHFRCDYHEPPWYYQGTLGVFTVGATTMEEGEQDHALKALSRLDEFITKFCTPLRKRSLGTECDQGLKDHILKSVVSLSADGGPAERRALYLAGELGS